MIARRIMAAALMIAAWCVAVAGSGGETLVPASPWVTLTFTTVGLAALLAMAGRGQLDRWLIPLGLLAVAIVATQLHLRHGFPRTHDGRLHLWSLYSVHRCILDGDLYPRWTPYLGLGYPLLQFYPPAAYLAVQPLMLLGLSPVQAGASLVVGTSWLSGVAAAWSAGRFGLGGIARFVAGVAFVLAPYHLHDANYRFALAELLALCLVPLFLVLGREAVWGTGGSRSRWLFVAAGVGLLLTHLLSAMMAGVVLGIWVLAEWCLGRWREWRVASLGLCRVVALCLAAAALCAFFLAPALLESKFTNIERFMPGTRHPLSSNGVALEDLVERYGLVEYAAKRTRLPDDVEPNHVIPFYFGLTLLGMAAAAVALTAVRRDGGGEGRVPPAAVGGLFAAGGCCLLFSAGMPAGLLDGITPLRALQFPWRFLGPASVAAALLAGVAVEHAASSRRVRIVLGAVALVALVIDAWPYLGAPDWHEPHLGASHLIYSQKADTYAESHESVDADLPADRFTRVEWLRFPPSDLLYRVASAHRSHREYMTPAVFENYLVLGPRAANEEVSAAFGVSRRYRVADPDPLRFEAAPLASYRPMGGVDYRPLPLPQVHPERIVMTLPPDFVGGRVRALFQAFPGWIARVDGGEWQDALEEDGLLVVDVAEGAQAVELRYSWRTPARRAGLVLSAAAWVAAVLAALYLRRHRRAEVGLTSG